MTRSPSGSVWQVTFSPAAERSLRKLDKAAQIKSRSCVTSIVVSRRLRIHAVLAMHSMAISRVYGDTGYLTIGSFAGLKMQKSLFWSSKSDIGAKFTADSNRESVILSSDGNHAGTSGRFPRLSDVGRNLPVMELPMTTPSSIPENRIRELAYRLWLEEGQPQGKEAEHWQKARELLALESETEEGFTDGHNGASRGAPVEEAGLPGESPTVTGQGKQKTAKKRRPSVSKKRPM